MSEDTPLHLQEPYSCKSCRHSFYGSNDRHLQHLRCGRNQHSQQCRYERHETGECGPHAIFFKARGA